MLLDKNLFFKNHIDQIIIKISKTVGMIAKLRHFLPRKTLIQIYNSLIGPYLSYAIAVWYGSPGGTLSGLQICSFHLFWFVNLQFSPLLVCKFAVFILS